MAKVQAKKVVIQAAAAELYISRSGSLQLNDKQVSDMVAKAFGLGGNKNEYSWSGRVKVSIVIEELPRELETSGIPVYPVEIVEQYLKDKGIMESWHSLSYDTPDQREFEYEGKRYGITDQDDVYEIMETPKGWEAAETSVAVEE